MWRVRMMRIHLRRDGRAASGWARPADRRGRRRAHDLRHKYAKPKIIEELLRFLEILNPKRAGAPRGVYARETPPSSSVGLCIDEESESDGALSAIKVVRERRDSLESARCPSV